MWRRQPLSEIKIWVPGMGFEPIRSCELRFLRPLRLPLRHPGPDGRIADYRHSRSVRWFEPQIGALRPGRSNEMDYALRIGGGHHYRLAEVANLTFLFLLTAGPRTDAADTVTELAAAAQQLGHQVTVFLAGDGVAHAGSLAGRFAVTLCDADLRWRQVVAAETPGVTRGSLADFARLARGADRILSFG